MSDDNDLEEFAREFNEQQARKDEALADYENLKAHRDELLAKLQAAEGERDATEKVYQMNRRYVEDAKFKIQSLERERDQLKEALSLALAAIDKSIAIADDYADSGISKPIRQVRDEIRSKVPGVK